jgi:hypothetical protein
MKHTLELHERKRLYHRDHERRRRAASSSGCLDCKAPKRFGRGRRWCDACLSRRAIESKERRKREDEIYRKAHRDKSREWSLKWYRNNRTDRLVYMKIYGQGNQEKTRNRKLRKLYGIDLAAYRQLLSMQNGKCAICLGLRWTAPSAYALPLTI